MPQIDGQLPSEDEDFDITSQSTDFHEPDSDQTNVQTETTAEPSNSTDTDTANETETTSNSVEEAVSNDAEAAPTSDTEHSVQAASEESKPIAGPPFIVAKKPVAPRIVDGISAAPVSVPTPPEIPTAPEHVQSSSPAITPATSSKPKKSLWPSIRLVGEAILLIAVIALGLWSWSLYNDRRDLNAQVASLNANPQQAVEKQTQALIADVSQLIQLPSNETPTVALVSDAAQAKQQSSFFANAENGDKVLMYVKAGEAILYRPSTDKIILVAPLSLSSTSATSGTTTSATSSTKTTK